MKISQILAIILALISLSLPACHMHKEQAHEEHNKIVVTSPVAKDVIITQQYVCQIHSRRHIKYGTNTSRNGFHEVAIPSSAPDSAGRRERSAHHAAVTGSMIGHATCPSRTLENPACVTSTADAIEIVPPAAVLAVMAADANRQTNPTDHHTTTAAGSGARHN